MGFEANPVELLESEFEKGTSLEKCRQCGCMLGALEEIKECLSSAADREAAALLAKVESWLGRMKSSTYT